MKAHIFKSRKKGAMQFSLVITAGASLSEGVLFEYFFNDKNSCKRQAKVLGATPHNY
jgi:hypothetical protein